MAWAARYGLRFVDTFGWKEQKTAQGIEQLYGMARVEVEAVKDVLRVSGTEGVFLEPHRQQLATRVTWEQPDKNEAHEAYLERMFKGKGDLGLATCGHTLGYRYELLTGDRVKRAWVLRDAPLHFGFLEAAEALQTAFKDVTITSCKRVRQAKSFFFKATADAAANRDALPVPIIYDGSEMTLWAVWSLPATASCTADGSPRLCPGAGDSQVAGHCTYHRASGRGRGGREGDPSSQEAETPRE